MDYTTNYHLPQWVESDRIMMEDFNEAMAAIDEGIKEVDEAVSQGLAEVAANLGSAGKNARIIWGTYTGTGTYGQSNPTSLTFDFCPIAVFCGSVERAHQGGSPSILMRNQSKARCDASATAMDIIWQEKGVYWYNNQHPDYQNNTSGYNYFYVAIGYDANT